MTGIQLVIDATSDGTGWICRVRWPDGVEYVREIGPIVVAGLPNVVITDPDTVLATLEGWVRRAPGEWRPEWRRG